MTCTSSKSCACMIVSRDSIRVCTYFNARVQAAQGIVNTDFEAGNKLYYVVLSTSIASPRIKISGLD